MNFNYKGSLAERFIKFRSGLLANVDTSTDLFNAISVYLPSNLATDNLVSVSLTGIKTAPVVLTVTLDNYKTVLKGDLLEQYRSIFNSDTNIDVILYIVVFYVPSAADTPDVFADFLTVTDFAIAYAPLTTAFRLLYSISFFKTMFSPKYDGVTVALGYDDQNYFDMALSLSQLCLGQLDLSMCLLFEVQTLPLATVDTNNAAFLSKTRAEEIEAATALNVVIDGVTNPRRKYFWGMLVLMQAINTWLVTHSEQHNLFPFIFGKEMEERNDTGTYIGNKLCKIRLSDSKIKPMGTPSILNSEANVNMDLALAEILDSKYISYLISIADGTLNDSILLRAKTVTGFPVIATMMSKWIDYTTSQALAKMMVANNTLTVPILKNEKTYQRIQEALLANIQIFTRIGRLEDISLEFPAYAELPSSPTDIVVTQGWEAYYVDDLEKVLITGTVVV